MTDTVIESFAWPINSSGEIIVSAGAGDDTVVAYLPVNMVPLGATGGLALRLPENSAPEASLPAASSMTGRKVFNSTYNVEMRSNGTRWIPLAPFTVAAGAPNDTVTNVTNVETLMRTVSFPWAYVGPGGIVEITHRWSLTNNANAKTPRIKLHTSATLGGSNIAAYTATSLADMFYMTRVHAGGSEKVQTAANAAATVMTGTEVPFDSSIDFAGGRAYLQFTSQPAASTDTVILKYYSVRIIPGF